MTCAEGHDSPADYLTTCRTPGVMLALFLSEAMGVRVCTTFREELPYMQLQLDVRGKLRFFQTQGDIDVGEIKRSESSFKVAKHLLVQRAKLFRWAMQVSRPTTTAFRLVGHVFIPRVSGGDKMLQQFDSIQDDVSILVHAL